MSIRILPPQVKNVSVYPSSSFYQGDYSSALTWNAIHGPADMVIVLTLSGAANTTVELSSSATSYSLRYLPWGNYSYTLTTRSGGVVTEPSATGSFSILYVKRRACC
jgi:hypothetical protein